MRRKLFIILALSLSVFLAACDGETQDNANDNPPVEENVDEQENDTEDNVEDDDKETEETTEEENADSQEENDSEEAVVDEESLSWPKDFMANVPEFDAKIFKVKEKDDNHLYVGFESVSNEEAIAYVAELKEAGFTKDSNEYISDTAVNFKGNDKSGNFIKFHWSQNEYAGLDMIIQE